jgi:hypothetical protein
MFTMTYAWSHSPAARYHDGLEDRKWTAEGRKSALQSQLEPFSPMKSRQVQDPRIEANPRKYWASRDAVRLVSLLFAVSVTAKWLQRALAATFAAGQLPQVVTPQRQAWRHW